MRLVQITAPLLQPVTLAEVRTHLRIDTNDEDTYLGSLLDASRQYVEDATSRKLLTQVWDYSIDAWPDCDYIKLPFGNLQSVPATQSVKWKDDAATETTLTVTTDYLWQTKGDQCGCVVLPYGDSWPTGTLYPTDAITIRFVCGWTSAASIPPTVRAAVLLMCAKLYESRGDDVTGLTVHEDKTIERLLASYKLWDEF